MKFFILLFFVFSTTAKEIYLEISAKDPDRTSALKTAIEQASWQIIEELLDPAQIETGREQIQKIIAKKSNRYILYTKNKEVLKLGENKFKIPFIIGISEKNLKQILLEEEVFYSKDFQTRILPFVYLEDMYEKEVYGWWIKKRNLNYSDYKKKFYDELQMDLMKHGFYLINPEFARLSYFTNIDVKIPKKRAVKKLSSFFKSHLTMTGFVRVKKIEDHFNVKADLKIHHLESGRVLAEVERTSSFPIKEKTKKSSLSALSIFLEKQKDLAEGLGRQMSALYQTGRMASRLIKITVLNNKFSYSNLSRFKRELVAQVKVLEGLKEHIIRSQAVVYLAEAKVSAQKTAEQITRARFSRFNVDVKNYNSQGIILNVYPK